MIQYIFNKRYKRSRNTQADIVDWLKLYPCKTEREICEECFGETRDKKHADLLRRALYSNKIDRVRVKIHGIDKRMVFRYFIK